MNGTFMQAEGNRYWRHPQGGTITTFPDGTMDARSASGRRKKTSATPDNLDAGHGQWREVFLTSDGHELTTEELRALVIYAHPPHCACHGEES